MVSKLPMTKFLLALLVPMLAQAHLPRRHRRLAPYRRAKPVLADAPFGGVRSRESETASYQNGSAKFTATAWRLQDSTGALAAYDWQRPTNSEASSVAALAAETADSLMLVHGNYLLSFNGYKPTTPELDRLSNRSATWTPRPFPRSLATFLRGIGRL